MKNIIYTIGTTLALTVGAQAALITNGDFASAIPGGNDNHVLFPVADAGWIVKGVPDGWDLSGGNAEYVGTSAGESGLGQANSITTETGDDWKLAFNWTPAAGALDLNFTVAAFINGGAPLATDRFFTGLNFISQQSRPIGGGDWIDLGDGSIQSGNGNALLNTVSGTAGVSQSVFLNLDFGGTNIEDYDYIGVKFWSGDATVAGAIIGNVAIASTVPEPSTIALLGLGSLVLGLTRKRRQVA